MDVSILLNNGDGTFQNSFTLNEGIQPISMASDDFNQDGINDLVVLYNLSRCAAVMLGWGNGDFKPASCVAGSTVQDVCLSDVDADGNQDLVIN